MLKIEDVKITFLKGTVNEKQVLRGVDLELEEGEGFDG